MRRDRGRQCLGRVLVKRSIQVAKHAQGILTGRFRYQSSDMALIADEDDLFLVAFDRIEDRTKVACDVRY